MTMESTAPKLDITSTMAWAQDYLDMHAVPNPHVDAALLMSHLLECEQHELSMHGHRFDKQHFLEFYRLVDLRAQRYPLQYLLGSVQFMGLDFKVTPGVFIPRPETELLVETTINIINTHYALRTTHDETCVLDLCTGCGNIAISLTKLSKAVKIIASDISEEALKVAEENKVLHDCNNLALVKSDLFNAIYVKKFDIIVANPPYVAESDFEHLMPELAHEPKHALDGGERGLRYYMRIFDEAPSFLKKSGYLIVEVGDDQVTALRELLETAPYVLDGIVKDYRQCDRVMVLRLTDG
jgi:release factor glutamine methyltransferase